MRTGRTNHVILVCTARLIVGGSLDTSSSLDVPTQREPTADRPLQPRQLQLCADNESWSFEIAGREITCADAAPALCAEAECTNLAVFGTSSPNAVAAGCAAMTPSIAANCPVLCEQCVTTPPPPPQVTEEHRLEYSGPSNFTHEPRLGYRGWHTNFRVRVTRNFNLGVEFQEAAKKAAQDVRDAELEEMIETCDNPVCAQVVWDRLHALTCTWEYPTAVVPPDSMFDDDGEPLRMYAARGALNCVAPSTLPLELALLVCTGAIYLIWVLLAIAHAKRSLRDICTSALKTPTNIIRSTKLLVEYEVRLDDEEFFEEQGFTIPKPISQDREQPAARTNIFRYLAWRRRALYAVFPAVCVIFVDAAYSTIPALRELLVTVNVDQIYPGDSLETAGGIGKLYGFLTANGGAKGIIAYHAFIGACTLLIALYQCIAVRVASGRSHDWASSRCDREYCQCVTRTQMIFSCTCSVRCAGTGSCSAGSFPSSSSMPNSPFHLSHYSPSTTTTAYRMQQ